MKTRLLSAIALAVVLLSSCSQSKDDQAEKIKALEDKIAAMEGSNIPVPADMAQTTTPADASTLGSFQFTEMEHDFGTISEGKVVEKIFNFTNNGQAPLVISNITASCGCTSPDWTKAPVQPGETGFVKVNDPSKHQSNSDSSKHERKCNS